MSFNRSGTLKSREMGKALECCQKVRTLFGLVDLLQKPHGGTIKFDHLRSRLTDKVIGRFLREEFRTIEVTDFLQMDLGFMGMTASHQADAGHGVDPEFATVAGDGLEVDPVGVTLG